jgi:cytochrome c-type protein NapB
MKLRYTTAILLCMLFSVAAAERSIDAMRGETPITEEARPPRMAQEQNTDMMRARNYPMQPPIIPHKIDGYQVDLSSNKCLSCHSRRRTEESQAPMVSVTHYMDRDGNFLAEISPRRYFCNQCHVTQTNARPLVKNTFQDVDALLQNRVGTQ